MACKAVFFGSIGTLAETSDIQRRAYNAAFREEGVPWEWDRETYRDLLGIIGGRERLSLLSRAIGADLDARAIEAIHSRKTRIASEEVRGGIALRAGARALMIAARENGAKLGFVTTTSRENIDAILEGAGLSRDDFDHIADRNTVKRGKPAPDAYELALSALAVAPHEAIAIEDTAASVASARRAGITTVATPGELSSGQDVGEADLVLPALGDGTGALDPRLVALLGWPTACYTDLA